uniref:Protein X n=1 Tax=Hepatitis B virus TaxID=10407 RepID=A0A067YX82_HBV|nr:X protein [Hepatitis B virus]
MAARVFCQLDPAGDVLCLRPVAVVSRRWPMSGPVGSFRSPSSFAVPANHGAHLPIRGLPVCALASPGPCSLRFTCARCMETTVNAHQVLPKVLHKRTSGLSAMLTTVLEAYFKACLFKEREELGEERRLKVLVLGGCRHKLVCAPAPCNFFTSA